MKVGVYYNNSDVRLEDQPVPAVGDDDILVKVMASGICGSDLLEWYRVKRAPIVLGHELTGKIVQIGKNIKKFKVGDRVFSTHHVPCGECWYCLTDHETACEVFQGTNNFDPGGFSQFLKVSGRSVKTGTLTLPDNMSYETGTFIEPLATVIRAFRTIDIQPGESIMIFGAGLAGILFVKLAKVFGAGNIIVSDINKYRMKMAKKSGAGLTIPFGKDIPQFIKKNNCRLADKVIISTGALAAAAAALKCVDKGGTVLFFAVSKPEDKIAVDFNHYWRNDISFKTCYGAAPLDNNQALELLRTGAVSVEEMITHRFKIEDIGDAFKTAALPDHALKVIVEPN